MKGAMLETTDIRKEDLEEVMLIYKRTFTKHNLFTREDGEIIDYLKDSQKKARQNNGGYVVTEIYDPVRDIRYVAGAAMLSPEDEDMKKKHARFKIKHLAVLPKFQKLGVGAELMQEMVDRVEMAVENKRLKTAKIEIHVAEGNKAAVGFYKRFGFKVEATLKDHYRYGEKMHIMGRLVK